MKSGNIVAKDTLNKYCGEEIKSQRILGFKGLLGQFGINNLVTKFTKNNQEKGFNHIQKEIGNEFMKPFNLNNLYRKGFKKNEKKERKVFELNKTLAEQGNINAK